uniref:Transposase n=1 Tax=Hirondellea gigas TaxID=1518452 RepID=A0A6A7FSW8_9CRUS
MMNLSLLLIMSFSFAHQLQGVWPKSAITRRVPGLMQHSPRSRSLSSFSDMCLRETLCYTSKKRALSDEEVDNMLQRIDEEEDEDDLQAEVMYDSDECVEYLPQIRGLEASSSDEDEDDGRMRSRKRAKSHHHLVTSTHHHNLNAAPSNASVTSTASMFHFDNPSLQGKNGYTWSTRPRSLPHTRVPSHNILRPLEIGPSAAARLAFNPQSCLDLFLDDNFIDIIVRWTNVHIDSVARGFSTQTTSYAQTLTTREEVRALLGVLIFSGAQRDNHLTPAEMWSATGPAIYRAAMSERRFCHLLRCLRFDNLATRVARRKTDKFAPIRDVWNLLMDRCQENYSPSENITVDEQLLSFRGKCGFRMYIPNKSAKYGIKLMMACDVDSKYMLCATPYLGKHTVTPANMSLGHHFTRELTKKYHQSHRNITTDNWFTSLPLADDLLHNCGLTFVGTIRANKPYIPAEMIEKTGRKPLTTAFCYDRDLTLISFMPRTGKKLIHLLSSMHDAPTITENGKPEIFVTYNETKGAVDKFDQMCLSYSCSRKTRRWPLCVFYGMLNIATINSFIIYKNNKQEYINRRLFMRSLAEALVKPWAEQRLSAPGLSRSLSTIITSICGVSAPAMLAPVSADVPTKRCTLCYPSKDRKTKKLCSVCKRHICTQHAILVCPYCQ